MARVQDNSSNAAQAAFTNLRYDTAGNLIGLNDAYPQCTDGNFSGTRTFAYDAQDRLIEETCSRPGMATTQYGARVNYDHGFGYDAADNFTLLRGNSIAHLVCD